MCVGSGLATIEDVLAEHVVEMMGSCSCGHERNGEEELDCGCCEFLCFGLLVREKENREEGERGM